MGLLSKTEATINKGEPAKWETGQPYDIIGGDHVLHVQAKLDKTGLADNYEIVLPKSNQLQIDYDLKELPEQFHSALDLLTQAFVVKLGECLTYKVTNSMSGNLHVVIDLPTAVDPMTRVAWQSVFGSDYKREGLSLMSIRRNLSNPTLLIEKKGGSPLVSEGICVQKPAALAAGRKFRE